MYVITFMYEDNSKERFSVVASDVQSALNCILTNTRLTKQPKFCVCEQPDFIASDKDFDVAKDIESWGGDYGNVYSFKNKLAENITVGNVTVKYGSLVELTEQMLEEI